MSQITVYGASDDLIEVEGAIREEFNSDNGLLAFSDGTLLRVEYTRDGIWRVSMLRPGRAEANHIEAIGADDDHYSDRLYLTFDWKPGDWVAFGTEWAGVR